MKRASDCGRFDDFVDDLLDEVGRCDFIEHLAECSECKKELQYWEQIRTTISQSFNKLVCDPKSVTLAKLDSAPHVYSMTLRVAIAASVLAMGGFAARFLADFASTKITAVESAKPASEFDAQDAQEPVVIARGEFSDSSFGVLAGGTKDFTVYQVFPNRFKGNFETSFTPIERSIHEKN